MAICNPSENAPSGKLCKRASSFTLGDWEVVMYKHGRWNEQRGTSWKLNYQLKFRKDKVSPYCVVKGPKSCDCTPAIGEVQLIDMRFADYAWTKVEGGTCEYTVRKCGGEVRLPVVQLFHPLAVKAVEVASKAFEGS